MARFVVKNAKTNKEYYVDSNSDYSAVMEIAKKTNRSIHDLSVEMIRCE